MISTTGSRKIRMLDYDVPADGDPDGPPFHVKCECAEVLEVGAGAEAGA